MRLKDLSDKDFMIYMAYVIEKLNTWKYEVMSVRNMPKEVLMNHPCNIDDAAIYVEAIKRGKPEIYSSKQHKTLQQMFDECEEHIKKLFKQYHENFRKRIDAEIERSHLK